MTMPKTMQDTMRKAMLAGCMLALAGCSTVRVTEAPRPVAPRDAAPPVQAEPVRRTDQGPWDLAGTGRMAAAPDGYQPPTRVALLLPLSGQLARAAAPVRDGFLAGYYAETRARPEVRFYDTVVAGAAAAYRQAASDGNAFIVGPLGREEVDALFASGPLEVPTLALNRGDASPPEGHASFSLSPRTRASPLRNSCWRATRETSWSCRAWTTACVVRSPHSPNASARRTPASRRSW